MLSFKILEKSIKFINRTSEPLEVYISPRLKGSLFPYVSLIRRFNPGEWWVPDFDWTGCSVVSVFDTSGNELQRIVLPKISIEIFYFPIWIFLSWFCDFFFRVIFKRL